MQIPEITRDLLGTLQPLFDQVEKHLKDEQSGIHTYSNIQLMHIKEKLESIPADTPWKPHLHPNIHPYITRLVDHAGRFDLGRFVDWQVRLGSLTRKRDIGDNVLVGSQGALGCMHWKGMPVFKNVFDFSLYTMMLWELKPSTIIELGSGTGSSAVWIADLLKQFEISAHIYSIDIVKPELEYEGVSFIQGDSLQIDALSEQFHNSPKPWLIIEDAHVNVVGVLRCMHKLMVPGDYLVVEDSAGKESDIRIFMQESGACYRVDSRFTDFFGLNTTSAQNSILKRVSDDCA